MSRKFATGCQQEFVLFQYAVGMPNFCMFISFLSSASYILIHFICLLLQIYYNVLKVCKFVILICKYRYLFANKQHH